MIKLGQALNTMKQNFIVVYLYSRNFAKRVELGDNISKWSENDSVSKVYIDDTRDKDPLQASELFDSRQQFLNFCQANHFQFDELRRAKHSTLMILFHLHNPLVPKFLQQCGACYREITHGTRYRCNNCSNFDLYQGYHLTCQFFSLSLDCFGHTNHAD